MKAHLLQASETSAHCTWKGDASHYDHLVDGERNHDAVWSYPAPYEAAEPIKAYIAFWHAVEVAATDPGLSQI